jgi:hypothetical protein
MGFPTLTSIITHAMVRTLFFRASIFTVMSSQIWVDYSTSSWCASCLNFPFYNMPLILRTYTDNYSYTPNNYFIWTHATHYLKTTNLTECVKAKNLNKQLLLGTLCYLHTIISLCNLNYLGKHLHTYENNRGC